ncbi:glucose-1-phosphate thymidylyltransferase [Streptomyces sp. KM77-8]|uniref:Glucose-1-phosphate thymidylyltransferase n=1 Tax=Streptomyces haneummycinicus TaxID=3074435 RepID=A0AAT9HWM0_9ACTN
MKALVLAGGTGTRLRPITHTAAKQLVPVANKPVLYYGIESIVAAGITEIGVVVGGTAAEIRSALGDGRRFGARITYLPQAAPLGLAHAVRIARGWLGDDDFVMYLGDNFIVGGITGLVDEFRRERPDAHILTTKVADPTLFGVAELGPDGQVLAVQEKPENPRSDHAVAGVYLFTPAVHEAVAGIEPSCRGELEITDAIQWLIDSGRSVRATTITGYWKDTGNAEDMLEVNRVILAGIEPAVEGLVDDASRITGRVHVEAGARIEGSRITGPAIIGEGTLIKNSVIGPGTSIAANCRISESEVESSIILEGARIQNTGRITDSLTGRSVHIIGDGRTSHTRRLLLGDHSKIHIAS